MTLSLYEFLVALILSIISTSSATFLKYTVDSIVNIIKFYCYNDKYPKLYMEI